MELGAFGLRESTEHEECLSFGVCSQLGTADVHGALKVECGDGGGRQTVLSIAGDQSISGL